MSDRAKEEAVDFGHRVGGTLFNPASLTHGCMGKHCSMKHTRRGALSPFISWPLEKIRR
jgi:hypothetical protein